MQVGSASALNILRNTYSPDNLNLATDSAGNAAATPRSIFI
jgi:hypothetical protein